MLIIMIKAIMVMEDPVTKMAVVQGSEKCFHGLCSCSIAVGPVRDTAKGKLDNTCATACMACQNPCVSAARTYRAHYLRDHAMAIAEYWKKQLLNTVDKWTQIGKKLKESSLG